MFLLMLRSGLRVEEVAHLTVDAVEYRKRQVFVASGKGAKDRVVYLSDDARAALEAYPAETIVEGEKAVPRPEGTADGRRRSPCAASRRGSSTMRERAGLHVSCHRLRHTFATQLLNADADLATIQDLLGHEHITTTQRYCRVANLKVQTGLLQGHGAGPATDAGTDEGDEGSPTRRWAIRREERDPSGRG